MRCDFCGRSMEEVQEDRIYWCGDCDHITIEEKDK